MSKDLKGVVVALSRYHTRNDMVWENPRKVWKLGILAKILNRQIQKFSQETDCYTSLLSQNITYTHWYLTYFDNTLPSSKGLPLQQLVMYVRATHTSHNIHHSSQHPKMRAGKLLQIFISTTSTQLYIWNFSNNFKVLLFFTNLPLLHNKLTCNDKIPIHKSQQMKAFIVWLQ
jgi:hypothetical protein